MRYNCNILSNIEINEFIGLNFPFIITTKTWEIVDVKQVNSSQQVLIIQTTNNELIGRIEIPTEYYVNIGEYIVLALNSIDNSYLFERCILPDSQVIVNTQGTLYANERIPEIRKYYFNLYYYVVPMGGWLKISDKYYQAFTQRESKPLYYLHIKKLFKRVSFAHLISIFIVFFGTMFNFHTDLFDTGEPQIIEHLDSIVNYSFFSLILVTITNYCFIQSIIKSAKIAIKTIQIMNEELDVSFAKNRSKVAESINKQSIEQDTQKDDSLIVDDNAITAEEEPQKDCVVTEFEPISTLSDKALKLYDYLSDKAPKRPTYDDIEDELGMGRGTISAAYKELRSKNIIDW